jgi:uncharacterized membrane protein YfcA
MHWLLLSLFIHAGQVLFWWLGVRIHCKMEENQVIWWTLSIRYNFFQLYPTHYELPLTMILGATVAGMTSEGGGAVAFPVMTLLLKIDPIVARDFSLMIVGFSILITLNLHYVAFNIGGIVNH